MIKWDLTMETHIERMRKEEREAGRAEERLKRQRMTARADKAERELQCALELIKKNGLVMPE